jgi:hypothetical protein
MEVDETGAPVKLPALHPDRLVEWEGQYYIADDGLRTFYPHPVTGDIVRIAGKTGDIFLELDSKFIHSERGQHMKAWWVHRVDPDNWMPDAIPAEA